MTPAKRPSTRARQTPIQSLDDLQPDPLNANRGRRIEAARPCGAVYAPTARAAPS